MDKREFKIVVGFPKEKYKLDDLKELSNRELHEYALEDPDCAICDSIEDFFNDLNDNVIAKNVFWFPINV